MTFRDPYFTWSGVLMLLMGTGGLLGFIINGRPGLADGVTAVLIALAVTWFCLDDGILMTISCLQLRFAMRMVAHQRGIWNSDRNKWRLSVRELIFAVTYVAISCGLLRFGIVYMGPPSSPLLVLISLTIGAAMVVVGFYALVGFVVGGRKGIRPLFILLILVVFCPLFAYVMCNASYHPIGPTRPETIRAYEELQRREREYLEPLRRKEDEKRSRSRQQVDGR